MSDVDRRGEAFRNYYDDTTSAWGGHSGGGSIPYWTIEYRAFLERFIALNSITSIVDIGCGDWQFSRLLDLSDIRYYGFDVVERVVERNRRLYGAGNISFDIMPRKFEDVPRADLLIMKDVLQHIPNADIIAHRDGLFSRYPMCLITNSYRKLRHHNYDLSTSNFTTGSNYDISAGDFRCLDLNAPPFNFNGAYVLEFSSPLFEQIRTLLYKPNAAS